MDINTVHRSEEELQELVLTIHVRINVKGIMEKKLVEILNILKTWQGQRNLPNQEAHQPSQEDAANMASRAHQRAMPPRNPSFGNSNKLRLAHEDIKAVKNGCLTENVLWKAISDLKGQYRHCDINGFRNTRKQTFYEGPISVQHILERTLHYNHWVLSISTDENQDLVVFLVDSDQPNEPEKHLGLNLKEQLFKAHIPTSRSSKGSKLKVVCLNVQQQTNKKDCGVFVIAFLVHFLSEYEKCGNAREAVERLKKVHFIVDEMRNHLLKCLGKNYFTPFSHEIRKIEEKECPSIVIVWDDLDHEYKTMSCTNDLPYLLAHKSTKNGF